jgi:hypothetical protein
MDRPATPSPCLGEQLEQALPAFCQNSYVALGIGRILTQVLLKDMPGLGVGEQSTILSRYAESGEFRRAVQDAVAPPQAGESEPEFATRAWDGIRMILEAKLAVPHDEESLDHTNGPA